MHANKGSISISNLLGKDTQDSDWYCTCMAMHNKKKKWKIYILTGTLIKKCLEKYLVPDFSSLEVLRIFLISVLH